MSLWAVVGFVAAIVGGAAIVRARRARRWRDLARHLEMGLEGGLTKPLTIRGVRDGFTVTVVDRDDEVLLAIEGGGLATGVELGAESLLTRTLAPDVLTGDESFDRVARLRGRPDLVLALLGAGARDGVLREIVAGGARLGPEGRIRLGVRGQGAWKAVERLPGLLDLAAALRLNRAAVPRTLEAHATSDPDRDVRLRNLRTLQEHHSPHPACRRASEACLDADRAELRLWGAIFLAGGLAERIARAPGADAELGERAADVLVGLATDRSASPSVNVLALRHLTRPRWRERAIPALEEALDSGWPRVQRAAVEGLARFRHAPSAGPLAARVERADPLTARTIADALGTIGGPEAESGLLALLGHEDADVRLEAIRSVGRSGSVAAVEPLLEIAGRLGWSREARAAASAKFRIQARLEGAERGQVSLAETAGTAGALSPATAGPDVGAVSMAVDSAPERRDVRP